jgi:alkylation response protein AidB-like acyl-CoA dehydrogenase
MVAMARANGKIDDPVVRQGLATYWSKIQILRINGLRNLTAALTKKRDMGTAALGATNKLFWSEMHQQAMDLAVDIAGAEGMLVDTSSADGGWPGVMRAKGREGYQVSPMMSAYYFSRSETIWGGSSQIQKNIVGEKVLGLPREPKPAGT